VRTICLDTNTLLSLANVGEFADALAELFHETNRKPRGVRVSDGMFLRFADAATLQGLADFVRRYGTASTDTVKSVAVFRHGDNELKLLVTNGHVAESLGRWEDSARAMRECVRLWRLIRNRDLNRLRRHIRWESDEAGLSVRFHGPVNAEAGSPEDDTPENPVVIASAAVRPEVFRRLTPDDIVQPALFFIQHEINEHLAGNIDARVLWDAAAKAMRLNFVPRDLLSGLWLQFASAFTGNKDFDSCPECGEWFEVSANAARKSRRYCSDNCKTKAYQERKVKALLLFAAGKKPKEIAKELGVETEAVKKWVAARKKDR